MDSVKHMTRNPCPFTLQWPDYAGRKVKEVKISRARPIMTAEIYQGLAMYHELFSALHEIEFKLKNNPEGGHYSFPHFTDSITKDQRGVCSLLKIRGSRFELSLILDSYL